MGIGDWGLDSFEFPETNTEIEWVIDDKNDIKNLEKDSDSYNSSDFNSPGK